MTLGRSASSSVFVIVADFSLREQREALYKNQCWAIPGVEIQAIG